MKVWVIAIEIIKVKRISRGSKVRREDVKIIAAIRLIWIPGIRPVIVPERIPRIKVRIR